MQRNICLDVDMDYEGFRQMVLGANLFSLKTKELLRFSEGSPVIGQSAERIVNSPTFSFNIKRESEEVSLQLTFIVLSKKLLINNSSLILR